MTGMLFDGALALALIFTAWRVVVSDAVFKAIVLFIVFGLLMAVAWGRLAAPHIALAEAAIGSGITGALLLMAYRDLVSLGPAEHSRPRARVVSPAGAAAAVCAALVAVLAAVLLALPPFESGAGALARAQLEHAAVGEAVTAVLLDFRGYDTLLEATVLALAVVGASAVLEAPGPPLPDAWRTGEAEPETVPWLVALLAPLIAVVAGYLLWAGASGAGGAFQAGAVLASLGVLLRLTGRLVPVPAAPRHQRLVLVAGLTLLSAVGLATLAAGRAFLDYPAEWGYPLVLAIETALMLSIALPLALLFSASPGLAAAPERR